MLLMHTMLPLWHTYSYSEYIRVLTIHNKLVENHWARTATWNPDAGCSSCGMTNLAPSSHNVAHYSAFQNSHNHLSGFKVFKTSCAVTLVTIANYSRRACMFLLHTLARKIKIEMFVSVIMTKHLWFCGSA